MKAPMGMNDSRYSISINSVNTENMNMEEGLQEEIELMLVRMQELGR